MTVHDNKQRSRFELELDGHTAFAAYRRDGNVVTFVHTEVPKALSGRGVGSALAKGALDLVRAAGDTIVTECPFIAGYVAKHPELHDLRRSP
ncbi:MAG: GNAT family N-acetyltransferase [Kofleriaceae bacterium]